MPGPVFWIGGLNRGRLAVMPHPPGGDQLAEEIGRLRDAGVDIVASLLTDAESEWLELTHEQKICSLHDIEFRSFPIPDHSIPGDSASTRIFIEQLFAAVEERRSVVVHCYGGLGRSPLVAASVLILAGIDWRHALELLASARGFDVPETADQKLWIKEFARGTATCGNV